MEGFKRQKSKSGQGGRNKIFKIYEEANSLLKQGNFEEALSKYNQVINEGRETDDDIILKLVATALSQRPKCQFRLLKF